MDQIEYMFGIPYKKPEVKNEEQEATEQPASEEQTNTDEEELGEEAKEMLAECEKRNRRQHLLEKLMLCVVATMVVSVVAYIILGKWHDVVYNLLWLFIAWMYWHQQKVMLSAAEFILHLLGDKFYLKQQVKNYDKIVKLYREKDDIWREKDDTHERQIASLEKQVAILENSNDLRQQFIDNMTCNNGEKKS